MGDRAVAGVRRQTGLRGAFARTTGLGHVDHGRPCSGEPEGSDLGKGILRSGEVSGTRGERDELRQRGDEIVVTALVADGRRWLLVM